MNEPILVQPTGPMGWMPPRNIAVVCGKHSPTNQEEV